MITLDKLWKAILEDFFPEAMLFFFPKHYPDIDWSKGFEILDKEQKQIFPESEESHRRVDMLVKVWLVDGTEQWILIHIEVQGYRDEDFARRMFIYYYRLVDRFNKPVSALAILTDRDKTWQPDRYETQCMETRISYHFPVYKLANFSDNEYAGSDNPWAWVMRTALIGLRQNWDDTALMEIKVKLYREFRERGFSIEKARDFLQFLKYYVHFEKQEFLNNFEHEIQILDHQKSNKMGIIELVKEHLIEEAEQKGMEKGMEKGMTVGEMKKASKITMALMTKYPDWDNEAIAEIVEMPLEFVKQVRSEIKHQAK